MVRVYATEAANMMYAELAADSLHNHEPFERKKRPTDDKDRAGMEVAPGAAPVIARMGGLNKETVVRPQPSIAHSRVLSTANRSHHGML